MSGFDFWVNNTDFSLLPEEDDGWCADSRPLVEWADNLISRLKQDPHPNRILYAKAKFFDNYARTFLKTRPASRRRDTTTADLPCRHLHRALMEVWTKLEQVELSRAIPELEPPPLPVVAEIVAGKAEPDEEESSEVAGIIIGTVEDDEVDEDNDQSPAG